MLSKIIVALAPLIVNGVRIVATDPAMRQYVMDIAAGNTSQPHRRKPAVRPHQNAQAFSACPACRGSGLVPIHDVPRTNVSEDRLQELIDEALADREPLTPEYPASEYPASSNSDDLTGLLREALRAVREEPTKH